MAIYLPENTLSQVLTLETVLLDFLRPSFISLNTLLKSLPEELVNKAKLLQLPASFFLAGNMCGSTPPQPTPLPVPLLPPPLLAQLNRLAKDKAWLDANLLI